MRKLSMREYVLLGVLLAAAVWVLFFRGEGRLFGGAGESQDRAAPLGDASLYAVNIDRLLSQGESYDPGGRNLFQYYVPPPPKRAQPVRTQPVRKPVQRAPQPVQHTPRPNAQPAAPTPPRVTFKYLGFLGPKDDRIAVFEKSQGEELELARVGDVVQGGFRLLGFGYESVKIGYVDERFSDQTTELNMSR